MSAFVVSKEEIIYLVAAAMSHRFNHSCFAWYHNEQRHEISATNFTEAARVANMLWSENRRSVDHRYQESNVAELITAREIEQIGWSFTRYDNFNPVQVLKCIDCYSYQSCEHDEWPKSEAFAFCDFLRRRVIGGLPGYDDANWGAPDIEKKLADAKRGPWHANPADHLPPFRSTVTDGSAADAVRAL